ncbi:hypothetical protein PENTCL1PPCAC_24191, partial [Pristionchus entomophagus]
AGGASSGFIRFEISPSGIYSPMVEVNGMPWKLLVKRQPFLEVFLYHRESECNMWSIDVSVELTLVNIDREKNKLCKFDVTFSYEYINWGEDLIEWKDLINEEKGFINDGKIIIEARFTLNKIIGIRKTGEVI